MPISKPLYLDDTAGPKMPRPKRFRQRVPYPIAELPAELKGPDHKLLLFCGDQGWLAARLLVRGRLARCCLPEGPARAGALRASKRGERGEWPVVPDNSQRAHDLLVGWRNSIGLASHVGCWTVRIWRSVGDLLPGFQRIQTECRAVTFVSDGGQTGAAAQVA